MKKRILYIHGLGGGEDSRIPGLLSSRLDGCGIEVKVCPYSFDPQDAAITLQNRMKEYSPDLVIAESLGACHAMRIPGVKEIHVSPALGAEHIFARFANSADCPVMGKIWKRLSRKREGRRQKVCTDRTTLLKYRNMGPYCREGGESYAFFGMRDFYRAFGIVSVRRWKKLFGCASFTLYNGSHWMEEEYIDSLLVPKILEMI